MHRALPPQPAAGEKVGLLAAAFAGLFACTGFEYIPVPAGEAKNPRRTVPLAMVASVLATTVLYMLVQVVAAGVHPNLGSSETPLADAAGIFAGPKGKFLMNLAFVVSSFGFCAGSALVGPRYLEAFAEETDGFLATLRHILPRLEVLAEAIVKGDAKVPAISAASILAKVYRDRNQRSFKHNADYKEGRAVRNSRTQRAIDSGSRFGRQMSEEEWGTTEARALHRLEAHSRQLQLLEHRHGARVVEPRRAHLFERMVGAAPLAHVHGLEQARPHVGQERREREQVGRRLAPRQPIIGFSSEGSKYFPPNKL